MSLFSALGSQINVAVKGNSNNEKKNIFDKKFSKNKQDIKKMEDMIKKQRDAFYQENNK